MSRQAFNAIFELTRLFFVLVFVGLIMYLDAHWILYIPALIIPVFVTSYIRKYFTRNSTR
ncbi:hypothetical protein [Mangrovibacillus cuniculi]|uniref:Uncharacterized protein n=1 Tax=Mangrovibacillus cuniculi TaxID=2593652 RepID=A0A7S8CBX9_9BACI|nr:hypothetical protein [Mangrovibacillus cuniculi]QPC47154.1 hypothetical protein G8O30_09330 [Mangrovibacillus cuniculi]